MIRKWFSSNTLTGPVCLAMLLVTSACGDRGRQSGELFTLMPASETNADFVNHLDYDEQLEKKFNIYTYRNFYNGGGVGIGDVNNDGLMDIFLTANMDGNVLYLNKGGFLFEDISEAAGVTGQGQWSTGVSLADVNGDGWTDIYVCNSGNVEGDDRLNELFINNGDLTFTEQAGAYGIDDPGYSTHGAFFDYDKDGDLDLYLLNNSFKAIGSFDLEDNQRMVRDTIGGDKLYRNEGDRFTDVSQEAGIYASVIGFGLGVTIGDVDQDGWMDIYVSNDFFERDYLYLNNQDGTYSEHLTTMMRSISAASMGADMADINNDRFPEIFVTDMIPEDDKRLKTKTTFDDWDSYFSNYSNGYHHQFTRNMLHLNNADGTFSEIGRMTGVYATDWSWGALIMDLDIDGRKDLFVANGIYQDLTDQDYIQYFSNRDMVMSIVRGRNVDYKTLIDAIPSVRIPSYAFRNMGDYGFRNMAGAWGLATPSHSNGSAYGDLDNDGDLDLVVNNVNMPLFLYRNETRQRNPENQYLKVVLKGNPPNTDGIGTKVTVKHRGEFFYLEQMPMRGFKSCVDPRPNIGLGQIETADSLIVEWPDGRVTVMTDVPTGQTLTLYQEEASVGGAPLVDSFEIRQLFFEDQTQRGLFDYRHTENEFIDFRRDGLIYHMMSTEGPGICRGDVNGDGLDDIYAGGAKDQPGSLLVQQEDGSFTTLVQEAFVSDRVSEDIDCALFDADGDGDLDLYVASGGNELPTSSSALSDRLYVNDGQGYFTRSPQVLPGGKYESSSCVRPFDYDRDGVMELFVGLRLRPFLYGVPVQGYILENDGSGTLRDVTAEVAPGLIDVGMIRDMSWQDVNGDGQVDMVMAGDWMPLKVFMNEQGSFKENEESFDRDLTTGWWNCIAAADLDQDGDVDLVAGNHGLNSRFHASPESPVSMFVNDFDMNGTAEQIICLYEGDKLLPLALKHDLTAQLPRLLEKYPKYEMYHGQEVTDIFTEEQIGRSLRLDARMLQTSVMINDGSGHFTVMPLPVEAQLSPVMAVSIDDYNGDGHLDLVLGGNLYHVKPEVGRYDASYGTFLAGNGKGGFRSIPARVSGLKLEGEIRDMITLTNNSGRWLILSRSDDPLQVFKIKKQ